MPGAVFISPHHDDVCFSLAATVSGIRSGQLINVYTRSDYAVVPIPPLPGKDQQVSHITSLRAREDRMFADACSLTRHDLMQDEPSLRGIHPFDLDGLRAESERLDSVLIRHILDLERTPGRNKPVLFCPMGIGGHRDHVAVLMAVVAVLPGLRRLYDIRFYEDLHYASCAELRLAGLQRFSSLLEGERLDREVVALSPEAFARKMSLVGMYHSQHAGRLRAEDFIPASFGCRQPHEAVWRFLS
jgi:hypothetical protein